MSAKTVENFFEKKIVTRNGKTLPAVVVSKNDDGEAVADHDPDPQVVHEINTRSGLRLEAMRLKREGLSDARVIEELMRMGSTRAAARGALTRGYSFLNETHEARTPHERYAVAIEQRDTIIEKALSGEKQDLRMALSALDSREKLLGLMDREALAADTASTLLDLVELASRDPGDLDGY